MLAAPYLLVGFAVPSSVPNAAAICHDLEMNIPWDGPPLSLGIEDVFAMEVSLGNMMLRCTQVTNFLAAADQQHGGVIRWFVQLCRTADISGG
jgi:hypothetical protein